MNTPLNGVHEFPSERQSVDSAPPSGSRTMYWLMRRELWENRSVFLAPLAVAAVLLLGSMVNAIGLPDAFRNLPADPAKRHIAIVTPYSIAVAPMMFATFLVGMFYSIDALYGERRDRSILFWKSLPVSDLRTVLAKAGVPLLVLPAVAVVLGIVTQAALILFSSALLLINGLSVATLWREFNFLEEPVVMLYGMAVHSLWYAPIYGWLLLVSAWARRAPWLWALLPPFTISAVEVVGMNSTRFFSWLQYRWTGTMTTAFRLEGEQGAIPIVYLPQLTPVRFLTTPGLWFGLLFAAACVAAAVRLRRSRQPI